jgi:hypothetical protein
MTGLVDCVFTAMPRTFGWGDPFGWVGLIIGSVAGIVLASRRYSDNAVLDRLIGRIVGIGLAFLGLSAGEVVRVFWNGYCQAL